MQDQPNHSRNTNLLSFWGWRRGVPIPSANAAVQQSQLLHRWQPRRAEPGKVHGLEVGGAQQRVMLQDGGGVGGREAAVGELHGEQGGAVRQLLAQAEQLLVDEHGLLQARAAAEHLRDVWDFQAALAEANPAEAEADADAGAEVHALADAHEAAVVAQQHGRAPAGEDELGVLLYAALAAVAAQAQVVHEAQAEPVQRGVGRPAMVVKPHADALAAHRGPLQGGAARGDDVLAPQEVQHHLAERLAAAGAEVAVQPLEDGLSYYTILYYIIVTHSILYCTILYDMIL